MTVQAQQIAIAKACGWKQQEVEDGQTFSEPKLAAYRKMWVRNDCLTTKTIRLPDYLSDLNSMNEAEKTLDWQQKADYARWIYKRADGCYLNARDGEIEYDEIFILITATAAQRAEAFLLALNLWTD